MQSKFMIERTTGALMVMIVLLAVVGMAGGPNIGSGEPYFSEGFLPLAQNLNDQAWSVAFMFAAGAAMIAASLLLYSTFRGHGVRLAATGAAALSVAGVGFVASGVAGVRLYALAGVWSDGGLRGDAAWRAADTTVQYIEFFGIAAILALAVSFVTIGALITRSAPMPRWVGVLGLVGAGTILLSMPGLGTGVEAFWLLMFLGVLIVLVAFVVTGGWLLVRGTRPPAGPGGAAAA